ncbi:MAG: hypothetical protein H0X24_14570 [Ktedonobacterales bacterium]|nr:hypothetical protein [Ktedonobacterales bacterium]
MAPDPIGPLTILADETLRVARGLLDHLAAALARHQIPQTQQPNYGWLDRAIWTLAGRVDAYRSGSLAGSLAEQATSINAAIEEVEAAARSVQHVLSQLP